jgi:hypothetical protein
LRSYAGHVSAQALAARASPEQLGQALEPLVAWARAQLPALAGHPEMNMLRYHVDHLIEEEMARYRAALAPPPAPAPAPAAAGLGSIFANAEQTSKEVPWAGRKYAESAVLTCPHCGGPQEAALDFICRYCKKPMSR